FRYQAADSEPVAQPERVVHKDLPSQLDLAGVLDAEVVELDEPGEERAGRAQLDLEIGLARLRARAQGRSRGHAYARQVLEEQQRTLDFGQVRDLPRLDAVHVALGHELPQSRLGPPLDLDLPYPALQH